ncbi:hypothetical protein ACJIZ3_015750 [Penstemon smallii]|uniref:Uncharacterized protein n=1 Tax=Penstemon smallii TaxID=265156 RepID=A0ABD3RND2_9LAMI
MQKCLNAFLKFGTYISFFLVISDHPNRSCSENGTYGPNSVIFIFSAFPATPKRYVDSKTPTYPVSSLLW